MRFRAANIGPINLINRRSNLPRLLLALSAGKDKSNPTDSQEWTRSPHIGAGMRRGWVEKMA